MSQNKEIQLTITPEEALKLLQQNNQNENKLKARQAILNLFHSNNKKKEVQQQNEPPKEPPKQPQEKENNLRTRQAVLNFIHSHNKKNEVQQQIQPQIQPQNQQQIQSPNQSSNQRPKKKKQNRHYFFSHPVIFTDTEGKIKKKPLVRRNWMFEGKIEKNDIMKGDFGIGLKHFSPIICIDVDDWEKFKSELEKIDPEKKIMSILEKCPTSWDTLNKGKHYVYKYTEEQKEVLKGRKVKLFHDTFDLLSQSNEKTSSFNYIYMQRVKDGEIQKFYKKDFLEKRLWKKRKEFIDSIPFIPPVLFDFLKKAIEEKKGRKRRRNQSNRNGDDSLNITLGREREIENPQENLSFENRAIKDNDYLGLVTRKILKEKAKEIKEKIQVYGEIKINGKIKEVVIIFKNKKYKIFTPEKIIEISKKLISFPQIADYDNWIIFLFIWKRLGKLYGDEAAYEAFDKFCEKIDNYDGEKNREIWDGEVLENQKYTVLTLFYLIKKFVFDYTREFKNHYELGEYLEENFNNYNLHIIKDEDEIIEFVTKKLSEIYYMIENTSSQKILINKYEKNKFISLKEFHYELKNYTFKQKIKGKLVKKTMKSFLSGTNKFQRFSSKKIEIIPINRIVLNDGKINRFIGKYFIDGNFLESKKDNKYEEDVKIFLFHIYEILANGDKRGGKIIELFIRDIFLCKRTEVCLVFKGVHGSGKNILFNKIFSLLDDHFAIINNIDSLKGFNSILYNRVCVNFDEVYLKTKTNSNMLKNYITSPTIIINEKNVPKFTVKNFCNFYITTNEDFPFYYEETERRYAFFDVSLEKIGKYEYFERISKINPYNILYYLIMKYKNETYYLRNLVMEYKNEAKEEMIELYMEDWKRFLFYMKNNVLIETERINNDGDFLWKYNEIEIGEKKYMLRKEVIVDSDLNVKTIVLPPLIKDWMTSGEDEIHDNRRVITTKVNKYLKRKFKGKTKVKKFYNKVHYSFFLTQNIKLNVFLSTLI